MTSIVEWKVYCLGRATPPAWRSFGRRLRKAGFVSTRRRDAGTVYYHPTHWRLIESQLVPNEVLGGLKEIAKHEEDVARYAEIRESARAGRSDPGKSVWISEVILDPQSSEAKNDTHRVVHVQLGVEVIQKRETA